MGIFLFLSPYWTSTKYFGPQTFVVFVCFSLVSQISLFKGVEQILLVDLAKTDYPVGHIFWTKDALANLPVKTNLSGEHGGDPRSVVFCHKVGMNYVSCSPFRVPIARLAAAQAAIR